MADETTFEPIGIEEITLDAQSSETNPLLDTNSDTNNSTAQKPYEPTSDFMSNRELLEQLSNIATHYDSLNAMCAKSAQLKKQNKPDLYLVLDAAIALQVYTQIKKKW